MQTFLPYKDFELTSKCLDYRRLGKQRVEALQIHNILTGKAKPNKNGIIGWVNHPAVLMWCGYENCLALYFNTMVKEWINRGYKNTMCLLPVSYPVAEPMWLGNDLFHSSHRSNLLRKNYDYYNKFGWLENQNLEYVWGMTK